MPSKSAASVKKWRSDFQNRDPEGYKAFRRDEARKYRAKYPDKNRDNAWKNSLKRVYGINVDIYNKMLQDQNGVCAICGMPPAEGERLAVDHNHTTKKVRGLVHIHPCNFVIGYQENYPNLLFSAIDYLKKTDPSKIYSLSGQVKR